MTYYVWTVNQYTTSTPGIVYDDGSALEIVEGVNVAAANAFDGIDVSGNGDGSSLIVNGNVYGLAGVAFLDAGDDYVNVGSQGSVTGENDAVDFDLGGANNVVNDGEIIGVQGSGISVNGGGDYIVNNGTISGFDFAISAGGGDSVVNTGRLDSQFDEALDENGGSNELTNSGSIVSSLENTVPVVFFGGGDNLINSGGVISGPGVVILCNDGENSIANSGAISGAANVIEIEGTLGANTIQNSGQITGTNHTLLIDGNDNSVNNTALISATGQYAIDDEGDNATIVNSGTISAIDKAIYVNSTGESVGAITNARSGLIEATNGVAIDCVAGLEAVTNDGEIIGDIDFGGPASLFNSGTIHGAIEFAAGGVRFVNKGIVDGDVTFSGTGNVYRGGAGSVTGVIYGSGADGVYYAGADGETFNLTASGASFVKGGGGDDTFIFTPAKLTSGVTIRGGSGTADDTLQFSTAGAITSSAFAHVSGIETIDLANGTNSITLTNAMVNSANGATLTVDGGTGADTINAGAVSNPTDHVVIDGGLGADVITAGAPLDTFAYTSVADSVSTTYDTIFGVNFSDDLFDVSAAAKSITKIDASVTGTLATGAAFDTDLGAVLGAGKASQLGAHQAVLFTANSSSGSLSGDTFLIVNGAGTAGYVGGSDLVIRLAGATGTLTTANFM